MSETQPQAIASKARKKRKKREPKLKGLFASGALFIGDAQFFSGSPQIELDPATGRMVDATPVDPLNPFNTLDRVLELAGEEDKSLEIKPYLPGRGVLLSTQRNQGSYVVKQKKKAGKVVGYVIEFID
jgi:hypothetical protein